MKFQHTGMQSRRETMNVSQSLWLRLFWVAFLMGAANCFSVSNSLSRRSSQQTRLFSSEDVSASGDSTDAASSSTTTTGSTGPATNQADYGTSAELPNTYVRCGKCQTSFALTPDDLGANGKGRRLECSVCGHSWFQSIDRIMTMQDGFEMIARPTYEIDRVHLNLRENKAPNFMGEQKLYVGNIAFECDEKDIYEVFSQAGSVGDVSLVRDDEGKVRGFGFVTMRTTAEGEKAIAELDGSEVKGRNIAVRPSNN